MRIKITETNETDAEHAIRAIRHDELQKAAVLFSARMHSATSPPFQPNKANIARMDSKKHAPAVERNSLAAVVSDVEPVNDAEPRLHRTDYPPR